MCGRGVLCQLESAKIRSGLHKGELKIQEALGRRGNPRWQRGLEKPRFRRRSAGYSHSHRAPFQGRRHQQHYRQRRPQGSALRPINVMGSRAPGMRAPRNTNQFLMHEKYQLLHLRSDSVGTDSGSDSEMDPTDMDSYLGVLENARGALMDCLESPSAATCLSDPKQLHFFTFPELDSEDSMQYFPSEDDVIKSENFMERDFNDFCSKIV
nr:PREDICTED: uncharacterized protein LOC106703688 [Latimeria chalumnae]|eukprot:XP_014344491.1 PREDICTED: uncharacterized protein LOC106703688 [Latimeria chalumnae]